MSTHTPGPWSRIGSSIGVEAGLVATVFSGGEPKDILGVTAQNARLIAQAPEMALLLSRARGIMDEATHGENQGRMMIDLVDDIDALLAKVAP